MPHQPSPRPAARLAGSVRVGLAREQQVRGAMNDDADVIVVGGGPAGSATAYYCAQAGLSVLLLDKATFPRDKVCGDGLTPRATRELALMGVPLREEDGWIRNLGLRVHGGGHTIELPWPELSSYPSYGMARADRKSTRLNSSHVRISYAVFC